MQDLGIFAFVGIMVSAILSLVLVPHFYRGNRTIEVRKTFLDRIGAYPFHHNKWVVGACLLLIAVSCFTFHNVRFNGDIANINYINERYKAAQQQLENITDSEYKSLYAAAYGNSLEEALERNYTLYQQLQSYKAHDSIKQFSSIGGIVLPKKEQEALVGLRNCLAHNYGLANKFHNFSLVDNIENEKRVVELPKVKKTQGDYSSKEERKEKDEKIEKLLKEDKL